MSRETEKERKRKEKQKYLRKWMDCPTQHTDGRCTEKRRTFFFNWKISGLLIIFNFSLVPFLLVLLFYPGIVFLCETSHKISGWVLHARKPTCSKAKPANSTKNRPTIISKYYSRQFQQKQQARWRQKHTHTQCRCYMLRLLCFSLTTLFSFANNSR